MILTIGTVADGALEAARRAADELGMDVAVYDMIFLKPIDPVILEKVAAGGAPVITVEDGVTDGGLGSAVLEWLAAAGVSLPVTRLGVPDRFIPQGKPSELYRLCGFDAEGIFEAIRNTKNPIR